MNKGMFSESEKSELQALQQQHPDTELGHDSGMPPKKKASDYIQEVKAWCVENGKRYMET